MLKEDVNLSNYEDIMESVKFHCKNNVQEIIGVPTTKLLIGLKKAFDDAYLNDDQKTILVIMISVLITREMFSTGTIDPKEITKLLMEIEDAASTH